MKLVSVLWLLFIIVNICYGINVFVAAHDPERGDQLLALMKQREYLEEVNDQLKVDLANAQSLRVIKEKAKQMGFVETSHVIFLQ